MSTDDKDSNFSVSPETAKKWDDGKMRDQVGISIDVARETAENACARRSNRALNDIGDFIKAGTDGLSQLEYVGSAAVHIYLAPTLNHVVYVSQTKPLLECAERLAGPAFTDLQKSMMQFYGRKTTKIRSGF